MTDTTTGIKNARAMRNRKDKPPHHVVLRLMINRLRKPGSSFQVFQIVGVIVHSEPQIWFCEYFIRRGRIITTDIDGLRISVTFTINHCSFFFRLCHLRLKPVVKGWSEIKFGYIVYRIIKNVKGTFLIVRFFKIFFKYIPEITP